MSKRQSKSAEFIGSFHRLDRNVIDVADHVQRWTSHLERWLRQLQKVHASRLALSQRATLPDPKMRKPLRAADRLAMEGAERELRDKEAKLASKIEAVLKKIGDVGFGGRIHHLRREYVQLTKGLGAKWPVPEDQEEPSPEPIERLSGTKRADALRARVKTWRSE